MRPFLLPILAITVTLISTAASAKERWEGYRTMDSKDVQDLNLPFEEFAKNAVFEMETVGMTRTAGEKFEIIPDVNNEPKITDPDLLSKDIRLMQIETCRKQELTACPVLAYSNKGTAFFNNGRFVTCRHGFHNWISLASQLNGDRSVREISPPMILRDASGEVVYNSAWNEKQQMEFTAINADPRINYQTGKDYPSKEMTLPVRFSDYVEMTLSEQKIVGSNVKSLSERLSNSTSLPSNETFLVGYSPKTSDFPKGVGDSPRDGALVISNGRVEEIESSLYQTTNYSSPRMSGGPLVTAKGELLGVSCAAIKKTNPEDVRSYTFPIGKTFAEAYWRGLDYPTEQELASVQTPELIPVVSQ